MAKKVVIPWELKADFRITGWTSILKGWLYAAREKYGADTALEMWERINELPHVKIVRLPASTTRLDPLAGYGGLDVHRRKFPTHRRYSTTLLPTTYINPTPFITS